MFAWQTGPVWQEGLINDGGNNITTDCHCRSHATVARLITSCQTGPYLCHCVCHAIATLAWYYVTIQLQQPTSNVTPSHHFIVRPGRVMRVIVNQEQN